MVNGFYITKKLFPPVIQLQTNNLQTTRLSSNETHDENSMECQSLLISTRHSSYVPVKYYLTGCNMNALLIYCIKNCHEAKNVQKVFFVTFVTGLPQNFECWKNLEFDNLGKKT